MEQVNKRSEYRTCKIETRVDEKQEGGKKLVLRGYPILFNIETNIYDFWYGEVRETILPTALDGTDLTNVYLITGHNIEPDKVLGRNNVNMRMEVDDTGLFFECQLPNTQLARDIYNLIEEGIVDGMSFGFTCSDEVNEEMKAMIEEYNDYLKTAKKVDIKVSDRMIRTSNGKELTEEQQQKIQNMKHVESLERHVEKLFSIEGLRDNTVYYILVDNWKNCAKVQKYLDSLGITSYVDLGTSTEIVENYQKVNNLANLIKYTVCGISLLIVYACCKNIIKNEKENTKLLHVLGYKNRKIKNILLIQLWMIAFVGAFIGYCISQILTFTGSYYLFKIPINVFYLNNFMIMVILIFLPTFILTRKLKMD